MKTTRQPSRNSVRLILAVGLAAVGVMATPVWTAAQGGAPGQVTFTKDVAPILQRSCQSCHHAGGGIAPMSLTTYEEVRPWARDIVRRTSLREMPPWFIEKNVGIQKFKDDPSLSDEEIATIATWVESGAPRGNLADMPPALKFPDDWASTWKLGTPDLIVSSPVVTVKAVGPDWFGNIGSSPTGLTEDRYIKSVEVREFRPEEQKLQTTKLPGETHFFVVHHANMNSETDEQGDRPSAGGQGQSGDFFHVYEVGQNPMIWSDDVGVRLSAGSNIYFANTHLHSIGREVKVQILVGFTLQPKGYKPKYSEALKRTGASLTELDIPAGQDNVRFDSFETIREPTKLLTFEPHMHATGKKMCAEVVYPTGGREMLNCAGYNHNWVKNYVYADDVAPLLPAGTILHVIGWYDNSANNPRNPEPRNWKGLGHRSIDDMFALISKALPLTEEEFKAEVAARQTKTKTTTQQQQQQ